MASDRMGDSRVISPSELLEKACGRKPIVLLDTNIVLAVIEYPELVSQLEEELGAPIITAVPQSVFSELEKLGRKRSKIGKMLSTIGADFVKNLIVVESVNLRSADRDLEELANSLKKQGALVIVATNDVELRKRLKKRGVHTAFIRRARKRFQTSLGHLI